jgi:hypothetical protein
METREDAFDYATQCAFWTIRHLRNHLVALNDDDSADALVCFMALNQMQKVVDLLSPSEGDWPAAQDGMGQVIPFIPRQRA